MAEGNRKYMMCGHRGCFHFIEAVDDGYMHLDDGDKDYLHDAHPNGGVRTLAAWRRDMPELFREYPDGKIGPNSAHFLDAHALDAMSRELTAGDQWPPGADFTAFVAEKLTTTGREV